MLVIYHTALMKWKILNSFMRSGKFYYCIEIRFSELLEKWSKCAKHRFGVFLEMHKQLQNSLSEKKWLTTHLPSGYLGSWSISP